MPPLHVFIAAILPLLLCTFSTSASSDYAAQRLPLGGSVFNLKPRALSPRADGDLGTDCGGDPDCTTTDWGCQCGFADGSWITDKPSEDACIKTGEECIDDLNSCCSGLCAMDKGAGTLKCQ